MFSYKKMVLVGVLIITLSFATTTFSRYILKDETDDALASLDDFYFSSNYLKTTTLPSYVISNYKENDYIIIDLYNYIDELRFSDSEIVYNVDTDIGISSENIIKGEWIGDSLKTSELKLKIPNSYFVNGKTSVRVTVTTSSPYVVTSSAIFTVYEALKVDDATTNIHDEVNSFTAALSLDTHGLEGEVVINFPNTITPDKTDDRLYDITDTSFKINVDKNSVYYFTLFKDVPTDVYKIDSLNKFNIIK